MVVFTGGAAAGTVHKSAAADLLDALRSIVATRFAAAASITVLL